MEEEEEEVWVAKEDPGNGHHFFRHVVALLLFNKAPLFFTIIVLRFTNINPIHCFIYKQQHNLKPTGAKPVEEPGL